MKRSLLFASLIVLALVSVLGPYGTAQGTQPLRIFIRSGPKSHGPGAHDYPRFLKEWVPLLNERGAKATGADTFPTKAQLDETDVLILHKQEAGNIDEAGSQEPERVPRARRRPCRDSRRPRLARSRLVQDHRRRLVAQRHGEVARRADAPLLHRSRQSDHEGRVQLGDGRRDLLRHGHAAGRPRARVGLHAEAGRGAQRQLPAPRRRADGRRQEGQHLRHPAADVDLREDRRRARARLTAPSSRSPATCTRTSTARTTAPSCCAASPGPASARTSTSSCKQGGTRRRSALSSKADRRARRRPRRRSKCIPSSTSRSSPPSRSSPRR